MQLTRLAVPASAIVILLAFADRAEAYPQFQVSTGNARCSLCHISPVGGGLLNDYGRGESETISQFGGNGKWLYGAYQEPEWMKLGIDLRGAFLVRDRSVEPEVAVFPMQGDTYSFFKLKDYSFYSVLGPRAQVRKDSGDSGLGTLPERFGSREYWLMWRPKTVGWYARAGRFFAPYGLRTQDHTAYVRRYLGFNSWEETYNLSGGKVTNEWEVHATAFTRVPDAVQGNGRDHTGAAVYYERRLGEEENVVVGAQGRAGFGSDDRIYTLGGIGKYYVDAAKVLLSGQLDVGYQDFTFGAPGQPQLTLYGGVNYWPMNGIMLGFGVHRFDENMKIKEVARDAAELTLQYFPIATLELMLLGRVEYAGDYDDPTSLAMFQLHYYL